MSNSEKRRRIETVLAGERPDRPPIGLWVHFPEIDDDPLALARETVAFAHRYDLDFIKFTPRMPTAIEDWGAKLATYHPGRGFYLIADRPVKAPDDWRALRRIAPDAGSQARQLEALRAIRAAVGDAMPILVTLFAPSMAGSFVADDATFTRHLREAPQALFAGLQTIAQTIAEFGLACLDRGADGIFYSIKHASARILPEAEYDVLDRQFDRPVAQALHERSRLTITHLHGPELAFARFGSYPTHVLNWYDRVDGPQLDRARAILPDAVLAGGIDHERTLVLGTPAEIALEVADAVAQTDGRGLFLTAGCTLPIVVAPAALRAAREALDAVALA